MESIIVILIVGGISAYIGVGTLLEDRAFRKVAARTELAQIGRQLEGDYKGVSVTVAAEQRRRDDRHDEWTVVQARLDNDDLDDRSETALDEPEFTEAVEACKQRAPVLLVEDGELRAEMPGAVHGAGELIELLDAVTECASQLNRSGR